MTYNPDINDLAYHLHSILERYGKVNISLNKLSIQMLWYIQFVLKMCMTI